MAALAESSHMVVRHGYNRSSPSHLGTASAELAESSLSIATCSWLSLQHVSVHDISADA
eukprot:CAMPEP_0172744234 /NCGR_PEP_ID=MMETSP1074-20121228/134644_1 /TAXON_ID=2916 /ORGANISM="Ceratium fusus, Strain PA161109" /LENGTH=58 /DNA_ID=CAMNT_0013575147 /DNA_START=1 /DNA_END=174 /DNA_ORIENTATION=+